jgi:acyl-CoA synthetase (AMP-forming)/AMP-acid ligase II
MLQRRAGEQRDQQAYTFLVGGEDEEIKLSYGELDVRSRAIATALREKTAPGDRVLLLYPPGLDYVAGFFGALYAGCVAVPAYPPDPARLGRTLPRLQAIAADCGAKVVLTISPILQMAELLLADAPDLRALHWMSSDDLSTSLADPWRAPELDGGSIAFLQYTSGSTATPRGVILTHGNLLHNLSLIQRCAGFGPESRSVTWVPPYHDMGLIGGVLEPCYTGFPAILMSPVDFLRRPLRWLRAMSKYRATTSAAPNFAFDLCVRRSTEEDRKKLDLSAWTVVFNGAEPINWETLTRFTKVFAESGFRPEAMYPCYGLAESTLIVSGGDWRATPKSRTISAAMLREGRAADSKVEGDARTLVGCGRALFEGEIAVVNPETKRACAEDAVGEIWLKSPSVARGYWGKEEQTLATFRAQIEGQAGEWLRTGDLGFLHEGELFVTGRLKDLIILNGQNHYPQDLERSVEEAHSALRPGCAAAFAVEVGGRERLVVAIEVEKSAVDSLPVMEIGRKVSEALAQDSGVPIHELVLLAPGSIPKTSSGKIQRYATRVAWEQGQLEVLGTWRS